MLLLRHAVRTPQTIRPIHGSAAPPQVDLQAIEHNLRTRQPGIIHDSLTWRPSDLLHRTIFGGPRNTRPESNVYGGPSYRPPAWLTPGHHLVYFTTPTLPLSLLPDGTDDHHYPGGPFTLRLWAGGCVKFNESVKLNGRRGILEESIKDVRITGGAGSEKFFLEIERRIALEKIPTNHEPKHLDQQKLLEAAHDNGSWAIVELRTLCFLRDDTESGSGLDASRRGPPPPSRPDFSIPVFPTPALLFRFSALTFNAHAIHIDPEYTRKTYGLPNLLVHGPLCLVLMLKETVRALKRDAVDRGLNLRIQEIKYKNLRPVFVNEVMRVCGKKKQEGDVGEHAKPEEEWDVWIETGFGDDASIAVRGTVKARKSTISPRKGRSIRSGLLPRPTDNTG